MTPEYCQYLGPVRRDDLDPEQTHTSVEPPRTQAGNHDLAIECPLDSLEDPLHYERLPDIRADEYPKAREHSGTDGEKDADSDRQHFLRPEPAFLGH